MATAVSLQSVLQTCFDIASVHDASASLEVKRTDQEKIVYPVGISHVNSLAHRKRVLIVPSIVKFLGLPHHPGDLTLCLSVIQPCTARRPPRSALLFRTHFSQHLGSLFLQQERLL